MFKEARLIRLTIAIVVVAALSDHVSLGLQLCGVHLGLGRPLLRLHSASRLVADFAQKAIGKNGLT
jgi:hypothetical protein